MPRRLRADEIVQSGLISTPQCMASCSNGGHLCSWNLSTSNTNAFYELGVRHALRSPATTIVIAEDVLRRRRLM